ncbi:cysteine desulfurase family protein [Robertmurraya andreesenii]|uniref:Cysteine desulfurase n=1 Tax=Anoxybacillus andreesenii TaxID=1325932 RepID=A0ABT9V8L2_9BACL|nr:cysteine desulfurase family protein [Robertmurraya andreesenii]MDQ0157299.1 cysteine desulfurase [Robertmurraya andreesenii]
MEIYLDNSSTTKPYPEVTSKVLEMLTNTYGNPSSLHRLGRESKIEMEKARKIIADSLGAVSEEIFFTSGGTESNNLAITGACLANESKGKRIVTTVAEHAAVTKTIRNLKRQGWQVEYVPAPNGVLDLNELENAIDGNTVLVSVMMVNNETGAIFPIQEIHEMIKRKSSPALLHCDAVQGYGKLPFTASSIGADLISISAHKIHGVKGAGALYVKKGTKLFTTMFGGGQERGLRSGTESTPLIAAFGEAVRVTFARLQEDIFHMAKLRDYCIERISKSIPTAVINSSKEGAPHIVNFSLPGTRNKEVVQFLDSKGIYISSGASCKSNHSRGPAMLESLGLSRALADSALRVSFSAMNTKNDINILVQALEEYFT